ncbi:hypothetical protein LguiA_015559 [Lonicera macranthoides]
MLQCNNVHCLKKNLKARKKCDSKNKNLKSVFFNKKKEILRKHAQQLNVKEQKLWQKQWLEENEILVKDLREMEHSQVEMFRKLQQDI